MMLALLLSRWRSYLRRSEGRLRPRMSRYARPPRRGLVAPDDVRCKRRWIPLGLIDGDCSSRRAAQLHLPDGRWRRYGFHSPCCCWCGFLSPTSSNAVPAQFVAADVGFHRSRGDCSSRRGAPARWLGRPSHARSDWPRLHSRAARLSRSCRRSACPHR